MKIAVLSPHRDDAAFSCGLTLTALLRAGAAVTIVNVFTRSDYAVDLRAVPGNDAGVDAVSAARLGEDHAFLAALVAAAGVPQAPVALRDLQLLDAPLRLAVRTADVLASPLSAAEAAAQASELAEELAYLAEFDAVFVPLALGDHIDHRIARDAAVQCVPANRVCLYEDLPYAARLTGEARAEATRASLRALPSEDFQRFTLCEPQGAHLKYSFAMRYPSQIAPEVATEMAQYGEMGQQPDHAAERWYAAPRCGRRLAEFARVTQVERSDVGVMWEG